MPGSALKGHNAQYKAALAQANAGQAMEAARVALLKEDLYADLTGLIVRGVKRVGEAEVFDCIQTGRNGSESSLLSFVVGSFAWGLSFLLFWLCKGPRIRTVC